MNYPRFAPTCKCGSKGPFIVWISEKTPFLWEDNDWDTYNKEEELPLSETYEVHCKACGAIFEASPWD